MTVTFTHTLSRALALVAVALVALVPTTGAARLDVESSTKSLYFAGRCLAPVLLREDVNTKDLREMPQTVAVQHLYGQSGKAWYGIDESVILIELDEGASCGINVFDEDLPDVEQFMEYWLTRDDSPFTDITQETTARGDVRILYSGFCESCGYHVHAHALWLREARFTIYRVFATLPERT
jgi:hypothetical protein